MFALAAVPSTVRAQAAAATSTKAPADERQKKLMADAEQLRALAQALKTSVDATKRDELSVKVVHQAEQIEKLARAVREQRPPQ
jgi:dsDNA-binding SOS-regulon protein